MAVSTIRRCQFGFAMTFTLLSLAYNRKKSNISLMLLMFLGIRCDKNHVRAWWIKVGKKILQYANMSCQRAIRWDIRSSLMLSTSIPLSINPSIPMKCLMKKIWLEFDFTVFNSIVGSVLKTLLHKIKCYCRAMTCLRLIATNKVLLSL